MNPTLKSLLEQVFARTGDDFSKMESTLTLQQLETEIKDAFDTFAFTAWGENFVYFFAEYDGICWISYAPRHPCDIRTPSQGVYDNVFHD